MKRKTKVALAVGLGVLAVGGLAAAAASSKKKQLEAGDDVDDEAVDDLDDLEDPSIVTPPVVLQPGPAPAVPPIVQVPEPLPELETIDWTNPPPITVQPPMGPPVTIQPPPVPVIQPAPQPAPQQPPITMQPLPVGPPVLVQPPIVVDLPDVIPPPPPVGVPAIDQLTSAMVSTLLAEERHANWKRESEQVAAWQGSQGMTSDGKFGPGSNLQLALTVGTLPLVRYWPKASGANPKAALADYKAAIREIAATRQHPLHRQQLEAYLLREQGQAFGPPQGDGAKAPVL